MKRLLYGLLISFSSLFFHIAYSATPNTIDHVIYITFDGTRWQDVYLDNDRFKKFWQKHANKVRLYGQPDSHTHIEVASIPISMPSYQSQMAGSVQPCRGNFCGRIPVETFLEFLKKQLALPKHDIAVFASWFEISFAAEHISGTLMTNSGNYPMLDPITHLPDAEMLDTNLKQIMDHPIGINRYDKYTFAHAIHYFEKYLPRFMWISLNDADHAAHMRQLDQYHAALSRYDDMLDELFTKLETLQLTKNTMVIITTDHGRGDGEHWTDHGPQLPESKQTWAFVYNGELLPVSKQDAETYYSTLSIRPTVENVLKPA